MRRPLHRPAQKRGCRLSCFPPRACLRTWLLRLMDEGGTPRSPKIRRQIKPPTLCVVQMCLSISAEIFGAFMACSRRLLIRVLSHRGTSLSLFHIEVVFHTARLLISVAVHLIHLAEACSASSPCLRFVGMSSLSHFVTPCVIVCRAFFWKEMLPLDVHLVIRNSTCAILNKSSVICSFHRLLCQRSPCTRREVGRDQGQFPATYIDERLDAQVKSGIRCS